MSLKLHPVWRKYAAKHKSIIPHLSVNPATNCILWTGPTRDRGSSRSTKPSRYGHTPSHKARQPYMQFLGCRISPRRFLYEVQNSVLLPPDARLKATCKNAHCVNPDHMVVE